MIELKGVHFAYENKGETDAGFALRCDALSLEAGSCSAVVGPSGAGKTTLLHLLAGILPVGGGTLEVAGQPLHEMNEAARRRFRLGQVGLVFQSIELLDYLDVRDNILLPFRLGGGLALNGEARDHAAHLAAGVGLSDKLGRRIDRLSQGERQRVAICRALVARPKLLLADEPTSALDADTAKATVEMMFDLAGSLGTTLVVLTHDAALLPRFERVVRVRAGVVEGQGQATSASPSERGGR